MYRTICDCCRADIEKFEELVKVQVRNRRVPDEESQNGLEHTLHYHATCFYGSSSSLLEGYERVSYILRTGIE